MTSDTAAHFKRRLSGPALTPIYSSADEALFIFVAFDHAL
jgi:hypothetical protein